MCKRATCNVLAHFVCEEVPTVEDVPVDGARYFHAVYVKKAKSIQHFDGAGRIYTATEIEARHNVHARNAGKMGLREKVFLTEGPASPDALSEIAQTFFVWNEDVRAVLRAHSRQRIGCLTPAFSQRRPMRS